MITVVCTTYFPPGEQGAQRVEESVAAIQSWNKYLTCTDGPLLLHVADDGSDPDHWTVFLDVLSKRLRAFTDLTISQQDRHGVGASLNAGFTLARERGHLALYAVDDWRLHAEMDLTQWARLLNTSPEDERPPVGMVRLGPPHPWLTGRVELFQSGWAMRLDRHHFAFGHRPALYHQRMLDRYGLFAEDVNAYECERLYNLRFCDQAGPDILLALPTPWSHDSTVELADVEPGRSS